MFPFLSCSQTEWCETHFLFLFWTEVYFQLPNRRISIQVTLFQSRFLSDILHYVFPLLCLTHFQSVIVGPFLCMLSSFSSWLNSNFIWTFVSIYANGREKKSFWIHFETRACFQQDVCFGNVKLQLLPALLLKKILKCYTFKHIWDTR